MRLAFTYYIPGADGVSRPYTQGTEKSALPADVIEALEGNPRAFTDAVGYESDAPTLSVVGDGETGPANAAPVEAGPPPLSGKGSGVNAWRVFAEDHLNEVPDEWNRDDIVAALRAEDVIPAEPE